MGIGHATDRHVDLGGLQPPPQADELTRVRFFVATALEQFAGGSPHALARLQEVAMNPSFLPDQLREGTPPKWLTLESVQTMFMVSGIDLVDTLLSDLDNKDISKAKVDTIYRRRLAALENLLGSHAD